MKKFKKFAAAVTALAMTASISGCGKSTSTGMTVDGYEIRAGIFIFYTMTSYYEAANIIAEDGTDTSNIDNIKNAHIDNITAKEWIQNKAVEHCSEYVAVQREFEAINGELTAEEQSTIDDMLDYYTSASDLYEKNGIGEESLRDVMSVDYKRQHVFEHYYGFDSEKGMSEDDLKSYFNDNYARVEYITIDLKDSEGNLLKGQDKQDLIKLAEDYAEKINKESTTEKKLFKMDEIREDYNEYLEEKALEESEETGTVTTTEATTTTTDPTETTTTTTTDPFANEQIVQLVTQATTDKAESDDSEETETTTEVNYVPSKKANEFIFNEAETGKAEVVEDTEAVYVILRADLYERMTADDLWTENIIQNLQNENYGEDFDDFISELANTYMVSRNEKSFKRYEPFSLDYNTDKK